MPKDDFDDLNPKKKKSKHQDILDQIREVEDSTEYIMGSDGSFLPSSLLKKPSEPDKPKEKELSEVEEYTKMDDDWFQTLANMKMSKPKSYGKDLFEGAGLRKKKKKKKKDKNELVDYAKEFEPELNLYRNLLSDQNRFTDTLQREYDAMKSSKSSARGINKAMSDLVENITEARTLAMQLVEKNVNAKKLIAELNLKQKKEFGNGLGEGENMSDFAGSLLNKMINERKQLVDTGAVAEVADYTEDELIESLAESLQDVQRPDDVEKYLKYENRKVTIYASVNSDDVEDYYYYACDENGIEIDDYPLPHKTTLSVNRSTSVGTDSYGKKYPITWR